MYSKIILKSKFYLGNITLEHRYLAWKKHRIFFYTPQVLLNDLKQTKFPSSLIKCIVFDEAHRAVNDYAYVQVYNI